VIGRKQGSKRLQIGGQILPPETNKSQVCLCIVNLQSTKDTSTVLLNDLTKKQGQCYKEVVFFLQLRRNKNVQPENHFFYCLRAWHNM
jgi:hypothetical protein